MGWGHRCPQSCLSAWRPQELALEGPWPGHTRAGALSCTHGARPQSPGVCPQGSSQRGRSWAWSGPVTPARHPPSGAFAMPVTPPPRSRPAARPPDPARTGTICTVAGMGGGTRSAWGRGGAAFPSPCPHHPSLACATSEGRPAPQPIPLRPVTPGARCGSRPASPCRPCVFAWLSSTRLLVPTGHVLK